MKILMVASYLPYPLIDGGKIRLYNLIKLLSEKHEITLVCERTNQSEKEIEELRKICKKLIVYNRPKAWTVGNILKTAFSLNPLLVSIHSHKAFAKMISEELNSNSFDLIHVETFYVMQNLPKTNLPIVLVEHNIEYKVYEKYARNALIFLRPFLYFDVLKLKRIEKKMWKKANKLIAVSSKEQKAMGAKTYLVPNGVDINKFKLKKIDTFKKTKKVLFIGNFKWVQNRDSINYIIKNIWPLITSRSYDFEIKLWVVGKNIPESVKKLATSSIIIDENAPNETELIF